MRFDDFGLRYKLAIAFICLILVDYGVSAILGLGRIESAAVMVPVAIFWVYLIDRSISAPLLDVSRALGEVGGGVAGEGATAGRRDEIGRLVKAFGDAKFYIETLAAASRRDSELRASDLERRDALISMVETVEKCVSAASIDVSARTHEMTATVNEMARSVQSVEGECNILVGVATESVLSSQTVASATEELAASIREISAQVGNSARISRDAVDASTTTRATIDVLRTAVHRIAHVAKLIGDIAAQTNLLALNATIEAARAGDAGKGFAVVAGEVKSLASQTARSTEEITREVEAVRSATESAVEAVDNINARIAELDQISTAVAGAMEQQSIATQEIARTINQTAKSAQQVSSYVNAVSTETGQTGKQAEHLNDIAGRVVSSIESMRQSIIGSLRTSTKEADRRNNDRFEVNWRAEVVAGGKTIPVHIEDLSEGGAKLGLSTPIGAANSGTLKAAELPGDLPFNITTKTNTRAHVSFDLTSENENKLKRRLEQVAGR